MKAPWTVILERSKELRREEELGPDIYVGRMLVDSDGLDPCAQAQAAVRAAKREVQIADSYDYRREPFSWVEKPQLRHYRLLYVFSGHPSSPSYFGWQIGMDVE